MVKIENVMVGAASSYTNVSHFHSNDIGQLTLQKSHQMHNNNGQKIVFSFKVD